MKFINFAIVRFSVFLVAGILAAHFFPISILIFDFLIALIIGAFILWFVSRHQLIQKIYFGTIVYIGFFAIGYFTYQLKRPDFQPAHYSNIKSEKTPNLIQIKIRHSIKPDKFNSKYFAEVQAVNRNKTNGKILLHIANDSLNTTYFSDDILLFYTSILEIPKPLNPHQFDYGDYLKNLGIYGQLRIQNKEILTIEKGAPTFFGMAQNLRSEAVFRLKKSKLSTDERAIVQALVLGEKSDISQELYEEYAAAGAVHILAVSGLHVSIIYFILGYLLKPLKRFKHGGIVHSVIIVILLWSFAFLSGLSPSVTRAVTMFSFFAMAPLLGRRTNSLNTLFLSFLTLLIINPLWIFQVGFQLSYSAVFFILWIYPSLQKLTYSKYKILRLPKEIIAVSICAQLGVLPLSLYYFHQFPGLFLLTNIVVLPLLSFFMCGGIIIVFLSYLETLPDWIAEPYNFMVGLLNDFIRWVAVQDDFLFKDIHFSTLKVLTTYLLIVALTLYLRNTEFRKLVLLLFATIILLTTFIYDTYKTSNNELVVFHSSRNTIIGNRNGKKLTIFKRDSTKILAEAFPIKSYKMEIGIKSISEEILPAVFQKNQKNIVLIDSDNAIPKQQRIHTILLTGSPKVNINRIIDSLKPEQIIADGSNYPWYVKRWKESCERKNLPFHYTGEQGAFIFK